MMMPDYSDYINYRRADQRKEGLLCNEENRIKRADEIYHLAFKQYSWQYIKYVDAYREATN